MLTIYHNTRCSKSREGLEMLESSGKKFEIREYLKDPLSENEIEDLLFKLKIKPFQLVRQNESLWKENYKNRDLSDRELVKILSQNPKLIERPIVEEGEKAVIGRPPTQINELL